MGALGRHRELIAPRSEDDRRGHSLCWRRVEGPVGNGRVTSGSSIGWDGIARSSYTATARVSVAREESITERFRKSRPRHSSASRTVLDGESSTSARSRMHVRELQQRWATSAGARGRGRHSGRSGVRRLEMFFRRERARGHCAAAIAMPNSQRTTDSKVLRGRTSDR